MLGGLGWEASALLMLGGLGWVLEGEHLAGARESRLRSWLGSQRGKRSASTWGCSAVSGTPRSRLGERDGSRLPPATRVFGLGWGLRAARRSRLGSWGSEDSCLGRGGRRALAGDRSWLGSSAGEYWASAWRKGLLAGGEYSMLGPTPSPGSRGLGWRLWGCEHPQSGALGCSRN